MWITKKQELIDTLDETSKIWKRPWSCELKLEKIRQQIGVLTSFVNHLPEDKEAP